MESIVVLDNDYLMLVLTPNPCFDATFMVQDLVSGSVMRSSENSYLPGGKGINVARVCKTMGAPNVRSIIMIPTVEGELYKTLLHEEGHDVEFVDIAGGVRHSILINQQGSKDNTVIVGKGPAMTAGDWKAFCGLVAGTVRSGEIVAMMGSLPSGYPSDALEQLANVVHHVGAQLLVDSAPAVFASRESAVLDFITPNLDEAEALINGSATSLYVENDSNVPERALAAADALYESVGKTVMVTGGKHGIALKSKHAREWIPAYTLPLDKFKSAVGAGDSFVAGFAIYLEQHSHDLVQSVKFGMACAAAQCETFEPGNLKKDRALAIFESGKA